MLGLALACTAEPSGEDDSPEVVEETLPALGERPSETYCRLSGTPSGALPRLQPVVVDAPSFEDAVQVVADPGVDPGGEGLLVVERRGLVWRVDGRGEREPQPWLDLGSQVDADARGLLGIALSPDNAWVYAYFQRAGLSPRNRLVRIPLVDGTPELASSLLMLDVEVGAEGPAVGGGLVIDQQGHVLVGVGDASVTAPTLPSIAAAQQRDDLRGSLLRIAAPDTPTTGYQIPPDNPFVEDPDARAEIWALGFHDPRHCVAQAEQIWCTDSGTGVREELNRMTPGGNFGWPVREGRTCTGPGDCDSGLYVEPIFDYGLGEDHCGIVGGLVVLGDAVPMLAGTLSWADRCSGRIWGIASNATSAEVIASVPEGVQALGSDAAGEPRAIDGLGRLVRFELADDGIPGTIPTRLSETGCFTDLSTLTPAPDLIPYLVASPLWSDGLHKQRFLVVPPGEQIEVDASGRWSFPTGSLLVKTFSFEAQPGDPSTRRPIETRFMRRREGLWEFHTFRWRADGSDADLLDEGATLELTIHGPAGDERFEWQFPDVYGCQICHGFGGGVPLGPTTLQMNRRVHYSDGSREQLDALAAIGLLDQPLGEPEQLERMPDPSDTSAPLEDRVRAYLHANCAHCHEPEWMSPDLRWSTPLTETGICEPLEFPSPYVDGTRRVAPGDPHDSNLWLRMSTRGDGQMPLLGSGRVDADGLALIEQWISELDSCD